MAQPRLRTVTRTQGNNAALKDGTVSPTTCSLEFVEVSPLIRAFRQMVREQAYDVCELAFTTYLCAKAHGKPFTALPVFLVRGFHHGAISYNTKLGIRGPKDLEGRRVGVNRGYTVTTGVWIRGILQDEHGVDLERITWVLSGDEHVAEYRPPANVVPVEDGKDLAEMLISGELAAAIGVSVDHPDVAPLLPDPQQAALDSLRKGTYPINHLVVVRDDVLEAHPEVAVDIFAAFAEAKQRYVQRLRGGGIGVPSPADSTYLRAAEVLGDDPLPYGVEPNRGVIDKLVEHAVRQHILDAPPPVESLFHPSTLELTA